MKNIFKLMGLALLAGTLMLASCEKDPANPNDDNTPGDSINDGGNENPSSTIVKGTIAQGEWQKTLDFNNDGTYEYHLSTGYDMTGKSTLYGGVMIDVNGCNIWTMSAGYPTEGWDQIKSLTEGTEVGTNGVYGSEGDAYIQSNQGTTQYVGFKLKIGANTHYGWGKVSITSGTDGYDYTANWEEIYYNSTPNAAIKVGQRQ